MSIYTQTYSLIWKLLSPPSKRAVIWLAWGKSLLSPMQWLRDLIFDDYADGSAAADWVSADPYSYGDRVRYLNSSVYELITEAGITGITTTPDVDTTNWIKVLDIWIGARERAVYNSQKLLLEYVLNKYFRVAANPAPQIYIDNNQNINTNFWLSNGDADSLTSFMAKTSQRQMFYLGTGYSTYNPNSFTIFVPVADYAIITAQIPPGSPSTADDVIRSIADKYVQAAKIYNIQTY